MANCLSCEIVSGRCPTPGGVIATTEHFHAHDDFANPLPGMIVVAARRHVVALDELTDEEASDLSSFTRRLRAVQRSALGIERARLFIDEATSHHFHVWMVPVLPWMEPFGRSVESIRPALLRARAMRDDPATIEAVRLAVQRLREALDGR